MKLLGRLLLASVVLILIAGLAAPFLHADRFRHRVEDALDRALGRAVKVGDVRFNLFTGPGFSLRDVTIPEDPAIGIEPFAYVPSLEARIRILGLLRGRLEFSNLRLVETTVNLTRNTGPWNFQLLLNRAQPAPGAALPAIEVRSGRLNFKFGDTKSVFYFDNADVDLTPRGDGRVTFRFAGDPARTDRAGQSFGQFSGGGTWLRNAGAESRLEMELNLERSPLAEVVRLFQDRGIGLHGNVASSAHVSGPLSDLKIAGQFQIEDIHRWDLMPAKGGGWQLNFRGGWKPIEQQLELQTVGSGDGKPPVGLRFRLADYLTRPRWGASAEFHALPAATLLEVARHVGVALPEQVSLEGKLEGVIGYARPFDGQTGGWQGQVELENAALKAPDATPVRSPRAGLLIAGDSVALQPSMIELDGGQSLEAEGHLSVSDRALELKFTTKGLSVAELQSGPGRLIGAVSVPVLDSCRQGVWKGWVAYHASPEAEAAWQGSFELKNARIEIPGLAETVRIADAAVTLDGPRINIARIKGQAGPIAFQGAYRLEPAVTRPHKLRLKMPKANLADLETLFAPTLVRQQGFLARTLRFGRTVPIPDWLQTRRVDAAIEIDDLSAGDAEWESAKCRLLWDGTTARLAALEAHLENTTAEGEIGVDLALASGPRYQLSGRIQNAPYKDGRLDLDGHLETQGTGLDLPLNAHGEGEFRGHGIAFSPDADFRDISGCFDFLVASGAPRIHLTAVQLEQGVDTYIGQGSTQPDGRLLLELSSGRKQVQLLGTLLAAAR